MNATDNLKTLRSFTGQSVATIREVARDLELCVSYSKDRRTWFIDEPAAIIAAFNEHLGVEVAA